MNIQHVILIESPDNDASALQQWLQTNHPNIAQLLAQKIVTELKEACEIYGIDFIYLYECWKIERNRQRQQRRERQEQMRQHIEAIFRQTHNLDDVLNESNHDAYAIKPKFDEECVNKFIKENISQEKKLENCSSCLLTYDERKALVNEGNTEDLLHMFVPPSCIHPMCMVCAKELIMTERTIEQVINCPICRTEIQINIKSQNDSCSASANS